MYEPSYNRNLTLKRGDLSITIKPQRIPKSDNRILNIVAVGLRCSIFSMHLHRLTLTLPFVSLAAAWTTYIVPHSQGNDDTPALTAALANNKNLATDTTILFQQGIVYNILTPIKFPKFQNVIVSVQGNLTYAADIKKTQGEFQTARQDVFSVNICSYQRSLGPR